MRIRARFALAAVVAVLVGVSPAVAQPKPEAELKKAQDQLEKLLKELRDQEATKAKPESSKRIPPAPPAPPAPPTPTFMWTSDPMGGNAIATLKALAASKDPKTAALAKELIEQLQKSTPKATEGKATELKLELVPGVQPGVFEFKALPVPATKAGTIEFKVAPQPGSDPKAETKSTERRIVVVEGKRIGETKDETKTERRVVVVEGKPTEGHFTVTGDRPGMMTARVVVGGTSTLKVSADGKTAALLAADGTITIYDVATGKETMKFDGKK